MDYNIGMTTRFFSPEAPIILGLNGAFATGKTATAQALAPLAVSVPDFEDSDNPIITWDHIPFALPLHQMASSRQQIEGEGAYDRWCYEIHSILLDLFGAGPLYGAPPYYEFVNMVMNIVNEPCPPSGKARKFLQTAGTLVRDWNPDAFVTWMDRKIRREFHNHQLNMHDDQDLGSRPFGVVIDDVRMHNEAEWLKSNTNGILIRLTARKEVSAERMYNRDGVWPNDEMFNHESERQSSTIPEDLFDAQIDTSDMTVAEQVDEIRNYVLSFLGVNNFAKSPQFN